VTYLSLRQDQHVFVLLPFFWWWLWLFEFMALFCECSRTT